MDIVLLLKAVLLGIVEGLTEFLPISSTGHLIIVGEFINFSEEQAKTFEIVIQLAAILAVLWHYRERFLKVVKGLRNEKPAQQFVANLIIAFVPAAILGFVLHGVIKQYLFSPITVAWALIIGGFVILAIEKGTKPTVRIDSVDNMTWIDALKVGFAQCAALFPGVSRAGATIIGGMLFGLSRTAATEFSFFLAIPTMFAATFYDLYKNINALHTEDIGIFAAGFITSFVSAAIVITAFLRFVSRHDFTAFAYYRIVFGAIVLWYFW